MNDEAQARAIADAERLLAEWGPTPDEAAFVREQGEAIFVADLDEFKKRTRDGSVQAAATKEEYAIATSNVIGRICTAESEQMKGPSEAHG
jgi:hypothetical protein